MDMKLSMSKVIGSPEIKISGSKSETNRLFLLRALFPEITLHNSSDSDDSVAMQTALDSGSDVIDIGHAGTAMRFLTAYFSIIEGKTITLTGSGRMKQRPIKILVDALRNLDSELEYLENDGFPPLKITGKKIAKNKVSLDADVSSQYITALMLIAPKLEHGLEINLNGQITSRPYIEMTLSLLNQIGVETSFENNEIKIVPKSDANRKEITIESDWSSASYFYSIVALSDIATEITLVSFRKNSFQGDSALVEIYRDLGVETTFGDCEIKIRKTAKPALGAVNLNLNKTPDLAQTIAVTAFGLGIGCELTGLRTLKIKETDRIEALKVELEKLGAEVSVTDESFSLKPSTEIGNDISIKTYNDHRMAMAFAPLAMKVAIVIEDFEVVSKSYQNFWNDLKSLGFSLSEK